ncbi:hypothetical protein BV372_10865 [Nostoc sp. T09]|nr:hypothetical protein BV372_10865 [Nostoc sp. T09]
MKALLYKAFSQRRTIFPFRHGDALNFKFSPIKNKESPQRLQILGYLRGPNVAAKSELLFS